MVESVIKCYALYLFLPCATRPNGSGHPGRCGNAACKGQNFHAELCPLSISPEIVGSRLDNGAASVFLGALGERHGSLQHALHCFWRKAPRFVIARRPEADVAILRRQRQLMWGLVESNGFKFRRRVKNGKIFLKNTLKFYYYVLYCICKCFMECSSFSSARMGR